MPPTKPKRFPLICRDTFLLMVCVFLLSDSGSADPLNGSMQLSTSVSDSLDAESTLSNPASLGFQTELNGNFVSSAFTFSVNRTEMDTRSFAFSWGPFGFGLEKLLSGSNDYDRIHFALGGPLSTQWFLGTRLSLTRSNIVSVGSPDSLDLGLQWRPSRFFSAGLVGVGLNTPEVNSVRQPTLWIGGITIRPIPKLKLSFDVDTPSNDFGRTLGYQTHGSYEILRGLGLGVGYHHRYKFQFGFSLNLDYGSVFSTFQPGSNNNSAVFGFRGSTLRGPSPWLPATALEIELNSKLVEEPQSGSFFFSSRPSLVGIMQELKYALEDDSVSLVVLKITSFPLGLSNTKELFDLLWKLRDNGKRIEAFIGDGGPNEYLLASVAHKIHMQPSSQLNLSGFRIEQLFWKGTLDKLGVKGELYAKGVYKSAPEVFQRKESSPHVKQAGLDSLLQIEKTFVKLLSRSGRVSEQKWKTLLSYALVGPKEALETGLVDAIGDYTPQRETIKKDFLMRKSLGFRKEDLSLPSRVAIISANGPILQEGGPFSGFGRFSLITPANMRDKIQQALSDPRTEALVLRVSSGGGEASSSYEIASLVEQAKKEKPVIVSMGSAAASGGYLISAPGDKIFAQPFTLTGSIGVFVGKPNLSGLMDKIDLHKEILTLAPHADILSWDRPFSVDAQKIMTRQLNYYYEDFVAFVAKQRRLSTQDAEKAAGGRVWFGEDALKHRLIDAIGGLEQAVQFAAEKANIPDNFEVWWVQESQGLFDMFETMPFANTQKTMEGLYSLAPSTVDQLIWIPPLKRNPFLFLAPVELSSGSE